MSTKIAVLGLGEIGKTVLAQLSQNPQVDAHGFDITNGHDLSNVSVIEQCLSGMDAVIATTPYFLNLKIAEVAARFEIVYFDVTEDVDTSNAIKNMNANMPMISQCGLAPGMVSIIANNLAKTFDKVRDIKIRVGALPQLPTNHMKYNFTWSTIGLINEYSNPCRELENGKIGWKSPLSGLEQLTIAGMPLEAARTSGGIGTLADSWKGKAENVNYKTIRYPKHFDYMKFLIDDLKMHKDKETFRKIFDSTVPRIKNDMILILIIVNGEKDKKFMEESYTKIIMPDLGLSAIQLSTVFGLMSVVDTWLDGNIKASGLITQESLDFNLISKSTYSQIYLN